MPVRKPKDLTAILNQGKIEPVYFLFGPEAYLRDKAARAIADEALRGTLLREFNDNTFDLATDDLREAIAAAEQLPMMSHRRVVRVKNLNKLDSSKRDEEAEDKINPLVQILLDYLARPVDTSVMIFDADDIDKRKKYAKILMQSAAFEFARLSDGELAAWARAHLKSLKTEVDADVLQRIVQLAGPDVRTLSNELNKLSAAALPSGKITIELVDALVGRSRELLNWDLTDRMLARNRAGALRALEHSLDDGAQPVMLIGLLGSTYRPMALAQALLSKGVPAKELFRQVPMPPFKQQNYLATLSRTDGKTLARQIARIAAADLGIKTSKATPRMQVEMLVCELMM